MNITEYFMFIFIIFVDYLYINKTQVFHYNNEFLRIISSFMFNIIYY